MPKHRVHKWIETLEDRKYLAAPVLDAIANVTIPTGKTLQIPLTASDADGDTLSYSVTRNGALTTYVRPSSNTFVRFNVQGFGVMEFQLFDDTAPLTVRRIRGLVDSGFYNGLTFHRILEDFVIQGGDPAGNGSGGPEWRFDDEFDPNSFFTGNGQLAMANSGKDTNGSQFFVTVKDPTNGPPRFLDGNHAIFGQLVRGFDVFDAVRSVPVASGGTPLSPVVITSAETYVNKTDGVLQVKPTANSGGSVTVRVSDGTTQVSRTFTVTGVADTSNAPPLLLPVPTNIIAAAGTPVNINLSAFDAEGDPVEYGAQFALQNGANGEINDNVITITPTAGFVGTVQVFVGVKAPGANSRGSTQFDQNAPLGGIYDHQLVTISFGDAAAGDFITYPHATVTGLSDRILLASFVDNDSKGRGADWNATTIDWGDGKLDAGEAGDQPIEILKAGDGRIYIYGTHTFASGAAGDIPVTINLASPLGATATIFSTVTVRPLARLIGNILFINGTSGHDVIGVSVKNGIMRANVNGAIAPFSAGAVGRVEIQAYAGDDHVVLGGGVPGTYIFGDDGNDLLEGGDGNDTISGGAGRNTIIGHGGNDRLNGSGGRDYILGGAGDDRIYGNGGDDTLDGQAGVDRIWGGAGNDLIFGGGGNDKLYGEAGNDTLYGQAGADLLNGGSGTDTSDNDPLDTRISIEVLL